MKVIPMKQSAMHRLTRIRLEAVRRLENLQNALISRKFPQIQITVKKTLMLIKMLICRSGFWQEKLPECPLETFLNVEHLIRVCRLQTCSGSWDVFKHWRIGMEKQTIYQHLVKHTNTPMLKDISWDIRHNNIPQHQTRKIIEALEIRKKNTETIMNGCKRPDKLKL